MFLLEKYSKRDTCRIESHMRTDIPKPCEYLKLSEDKGGREMHSSGVSRNMGLKTHWFWTSLIRNREELKCYCLKGVCLMYLLYNSSNM